eukprot:TRINITY_DN976_c4_g1_i5.p1 TRINITY_DN976_c4_g1~~TRINITY_DN976_c4_g1_i5.p1  ORF type:complete len:459 (+),score=127.83 TRINITY_DN976_c4_g1_i5:326-1702(+)
MGRRIIIFGGSVGRKLSNDVLSFDTDTLHWKVLSPPSKSSDHPPPRAFSTAVKLTSNKILIYGGRSESKVLNDVWIFNIDDYSWMKLQEDEVEEEKPNINDNNNNNNMNMVNNNEDSNNNDDEVNNNNNHNDNNVNNELYNNDFEDHNDGDNHNDGNNNDDDDDADVCNNNNEEDEYHNIVIADFGNVDDDSSTTTTTTDTTISSSSEKKNTKPKGRAGHTLTAIRSTSSNFRDFLLFGGWDGSKDQNGVETGAEDDLWLLRFNLDTYILSWRQIELESPPTPRDCHTAFCSISVDDVTTLDPNMYIIYGGSDPDFNYIDDVSLLKLENIVEIPSLQLLCADVLLKSCITTYKQKKTEEKYLEVIDTLPSSLQLFLEEQLSLLDLTEDHVEAESPFSVQDMLQFLLSKDSEELRQVFANPNRVIQNILFQSPARKLLNASRGRKRKRENVNGDESLTQ